MKKCGKVNKFTFLVLIFADDIYWFPLMLQGKAFKGDFLFGDFNTIKEKKLQEINDENYFMS